MEKLTEGNKWLAVVHLEGGFHNATRPRLISNLIIFFADPCPTVKKFFDFFFKIGSRIQNKSKYFLPSSDMGKAKNVCAAYFFAIMMGFPFFRILNRFSKEIDVVDNQIPMNVRMMFTTR